MELSLPRSDMAGAIIVRPGIARANIDVEGRPSGSRVVRTGQGPIKHCVSQMTTGSDTLIIL